MGAEIAVGTDMSVGAGPLVLGTDPTIVIVAWLGGLGVGRARGAGTLSGGVGKVLAVDD